MTNPLALGDGASTTWYSQTTRSCFDAFRRLRKPYPRQSWNNNLAYGVSWREEAIEELAHQFLKHDARGIVTKINKVAAALPGSLSPGTVVPIRGAALSGERAASEVKIGSGHRAAVVVNHHEQSLVVYMARTHDYAYPHYISAVEERADA